MRLHLLSSLLLILVSGCAIQVIDPTPDLHSYRALEISANSSGKRVAAPVVHALDAAALDVLLPEGGAPQRLHVQAEGCRNDPYADCPRSFALTGELDVFQNHLKCYIEIRNDANTGYAGQSLQGLCQDMHSRSYSITLTR